MLVDARWCSNNEYTADKEWIYQGYDLRWFDFEKRVEQGYSMYGHEILNLEGIKVDSTYYALKNTSSNSSLAVSYAELEDWRLNVAHIGGESFKVPDEIEGIEVGLNIYFTTDNTLKK